MESTSLSQTRGDSAGPDEVSSGSRATLRNGRAADDSAAITDRRASSSGLETLYAPVAEPLRAVEAKLSQELQSRYESVVPLLRHGTQLGGKRMRPAMLLLAGQAVGELREDHVVLGTVIEMVHTATLVHDDVLDGATTRRHTPTVNSKWNDHTSILLGDYLFAQSFRLAATLGSTEACRWIGEAARRVCEGELRQILHRDVLELDEATYLEMIRGKTAELCRVACALGARHAGADSATIGALGDYGDAVGIAFQIADDYLDLWGEDRAVGKTLGTDLEQGKMTLPLIRLLAMSRGEARRQVAAAVSATGPGRIERVRRFLQHSDADEYTLAAARRFRDRAVESLDGLASSPAVEALRRLADFAVQRKF